MVIVKQGLKGKNPAEKVKYGGNIKTGMTDNTYFADGTTILTALNTTTTNLQTANAAGNKDNIRLMTTAFNNAVKLLVMYVQSKITGLADEVAVAMVESANLTYVKKGKPIFEDLSGVAGEVPLTVDLRKKVTTKKKHVAYVFQICTDPAYDSGYSNCMISTVVSVTVTGITVGLVTSALKPQTKYWFRVATVEGTIMSVFSDPTSFTTA